MMRRPAVTILLAIFVAAIGITCLRRDGYASQDREAIMAPATQRHWAGTDGLGRDRAVRVSAALVLGLAGAAVAAVLTTILAAIVGMAAAFGHRFTGVLLMFLSDAFLSLPWIFLLMMVRSVLPLATSPLASAATTFLVLAALGWPACARVVYEGSLALRSSEWVVQGRAAGLRPLQLLRLHILPNLRPLLLPQFLICVPVLIVAEANLGALGLGIAEPMPSWGGMLLELNNSALLAESRWIYLPIAMLVLVLLLLENITTQVRTDA